MKVLLAYLVLLGPCGSFGGTSLPSGRNMNKQLSATCMKNTMDNSYTMTLAINFNGDPVDRVQFLSGDTYVVTGSSDNEVTCNPSQGTVSPNGYVIYESKVFISGAASSTSCGGRMYLNTVDQFVWTVLTREHYGYGIISDMDRVYTIICTPTNSNSDFVTTNVNIYEDDATGNSNRVHPENELTVLKLSPSNVFTQVLGDGVSVGQQVKLRVKSKVKDSGFQTANFDHFGSYVYSCEYWYSFGGTRTPFIGANGCPNGALFSDLTEGFSHGSTDYELSVTPNYRWFFTTTDMFVLFSQSPPNFKIHLSCYVDYCVGAPESDSRCDNFCSANTGRRKRQSTQTHRDQVSMTIVFNDVNTTPSDGNNNGQEGADSSQTVLIGVTSGLGLLILIIGAIILAVVCCRHQGAGKRRRQWESSSTTSSHQNLPEHLTDVHMKAPKY